MINTNTFRRFVRLRYSLLACILASALAPPAHATIMQFLEIEDLTRLSSDIFYGQVISSTTVWNAERTRIYTKVLVHINESFKGSIRHDEIITVTQLGGEKDGIKMDYAGRPEFPPGEWMVLFTTRGKSDDFIVVGLKQGKMRVEGSEITRDFSGIMLVDGKRKGSQPIAIKSTRMSFSELRDRVTRAR